MNRETASKLLPIIQAFAEGKLIQFKMSEEGDWLDSEAPSWGEHIKYRIKPEPKTLYYVIRNSGLLVAKFDNEAEAIKAVDLYTKQPLNEAHLPYYIKKFVEDLNYKPAN